VLPFLFTALFGALLGVLFAPGEAAFSEHWKSWPVLALAAPSLLSAVLWFLASRITKSYERKKGTLFIISALHASAARKDFAAGAIGRSFARVRPLPPVDLPAVGHTAEIGNLKGRLRQAADDVLYALGDDEANSTDNLLVNGAWWFGWALGANIAARGAREFVGQAKLGDVAPRPQRETTRTIDGVIQWHAPASRMAESDLSHEPETVRTIGGESVWATDVMNLADFASRVPDLDPPRDDGLLRLDGSIRHGVLGRGTIGRARLARVSLDFEDANDDAPAVIVLQLGPRDLTGSNGLPLGNLDEERESLRTRQDFLDRFGLAENHFGSVVKSLAPRSITWLTRLRGEEDSHFVPLAINSFENAAAVIVHEVAAALARSDGERRVVIFASIPEALQIPVGMGVEVLCARNGVGSKAAGAGGVSRSLTRLTFAVYDAGERRYRLLDVDGPARPEAGGTHRFTSLTNLTPHAVTLLDDANRPLMTLEPSGKVAVLEENEVSVRAVPIGDDHDVCVADIVHRETVGLPVPRSGVGLVVSRLTALANRSRDDLLFPAGEVRDRDGRIIGCRQLGRVAE
jgi:hypothetical protein